MRVTLVGHATLYVETTEASFLVDPVLHDPFEGGAVSSWPARTVDLATMPRPDFVVVTHRHPDHFDVASLAKLPRDAVVLVPRDPLIAHALDRLGFRDVRTLEPGRPIASFDHQLFPTPSEEPVIEVGLVFADSSGVVFDQVDTAVSRRTAEEVRARFRLSAHVARYASQNFEYFESRHAEFPFAEHARNLETAAALGGRVVVPGSAGFRFAGEHAWLNRFLFPVSRPTFLEDLARVAPASRGELMDPGDVLVLDGDRVEIERGASSFVRTIARGEDELRFDPTAPVPDLVDPNPDRRPPDELRGGARRIAGALAAWARAEPEPLSVRWRYRAARAVYGLEVVLEEGPLAFAIDFRASPPELHEGGGPEPVVVHRIAASVLLDWAERRRDFFSVRPWSRRASIARRVLGDEAGVVVAPLELPDLLMHWLLRKAEGSEDAARRRVDLEIATALGISTLK